ncbi:restriction endonuclease, partial [bacterium]|nr:restriction endonuclease [bacterium]
MTADNFREYILEHLEEFKHVIATDTGDWVVKGFIDIYRKIYTISADTKVVSKIIELMLFPVVSKFARKHNYDLKLAEHQNHYPDISFITPDKTKLAVDIKTTYRKDSETVNGFTL